MMLLMQYINHFSFIAGAKSARFFLLILVILISLQGCSSLSETEKADEDLDALGKDIVGMVDVPASETTATNGKEDIDSPSIDSTQNKKNLYLVQAEQRLANVPVPVLTQYKQALALMKKQQWQAAEQLLDQVLVSQPQLSGAYVNKAMISVEQKDLNRANKQLDKALSVNPINPYAHQLKGRIARLTGQFEQAEQSYLEALRIWPEYPEAQINLAILLELYRGRLLDARIYYASYLVLQPDDLQVQRWLAGVDIKIKRAGLTFPKKAENDSLPGKTPVSSSTINVSGEG